MKTLIAAIFLGLCFLGCKDKATEKPEEVISFPEGKKFTEYKAKAGDASAQEKLGQTYYYGRGVKIDLKEAAKWYRKSAEQGDPSGQNSLGMMYLQGEGVDKDITEGLKWLHKSADQDYFEAFFNLGNVYSGNQDGVEGVPIDYKKAAKWTHKGAEQGDAFSQYNLADMYAKGQGVEKDLVMAYAWWAISSDIGQKDKSNIAKKMTPDQITKAEALQEGILKKILIALAEKGDAEAQNKIGLIYFEGKGVEKDLKETAKWWRKAAEQGDAGGQFNLGVLYHNGEGVPKDSVTAYAWWNIAAANGDDDAKRNKSIVSKRLTPAQITKAEAQAKEMTKKNPKLIKKKE
jgi:hypothetical protein